MKRISCLLIVLTLVLSALSLVSCSNQGKPGDVTYTDTVISKEQTTYGALAIVNDTHEYAFPAEAANALKNIGEYRNAHVQEGQTFPYKISTTSLLIHEAALSDLHTWLSDMHKATQNSDVIITSAYRTAQEQESFLTPVGKSNHHTGYGVTFKIYANQVTSSLSSDAACYTWMTENAYKYGFVQRYPEGKESTTGMSDYTEHFHYVGYGPAAYMKQNNLCLEEFVATIKGYTQSNPLTVTDANGQGWLIYHAACPGEAATIQLPTNFNYTVSGDNEGGVIVCVSLTKTDNP